MSLNLQVGYAGVPNFGLMLAVAGGAFVAGFFPGRVAALLFGVDPNLDYVNNNSQVLQQVSIGLHSNIPLSVVLFLSTLILAVLFGGVLGYVASFPAIRLREDYLAITLLAMAEGIRIIGNNYPPIVGATQGVGVADVFGWIPDASLGPVTYRFTMLTFILIGVALLVVFYSELVARSPLSRALRAVRDNPLAAEALGKDIVKLRMKVLVVGSGIAALAGALFSFYSGAVFANTYDRTTWTFIPWVMVILGGAANNSGVVAGTFLYVTGRKLIAFYKQSLVGIVPFDVVWLDTMLLGVVLIAALIFRPQGIFAEKSSHTLSREKMREIILRQTSNQKT